MTPTQGNVIEPGAPPTSAARAGKQSALGPGAAALLTCLVPGLAHFRLGYPQRGAIALVTTVAPFWIGWTILGPFLWSMLLFNKPFEAVAAVLGYVPIHLLPESPNLGCSILAAILKPAYTTETARLMQLPPDSPFMTHLGLFLTGATGILAALWAADAHYLARGRVVGMAPGTAAILAWLLPGSSHAVMGQRSKGMLIGGATLFVFLLGLALAAGHAVDRQLHSAWWIGDILCGGGTLLATFTTSPLRYTAVPPFYDYGLALCAVAGFMNLIVIIDAYSIAERRGLGEDLVETVP